MVAVEAVVNNMNIFKHMVMKYMKYIRKVGSIIIFNSNMR